MENVLRLDLHALIPRFAPLRLHDPARCCLPDYFTGNFPNYIAISGADLPTLNAPV